VRFTVSVLPAEEAGLKLHKGVVNGLVMSQKNGNGAPLVTAVQPGAMLSNVALFIDSNKASMQPAAATEDWWCAASPCAGLLFHLSAFVCVLSAHCRRSTHCLSSACSRL
jgi:hypothetical protein